MALYVGAIPQTLYYQPLQYHSLSYILKPCGTDVRSSNLTPYCHIYLPYITTFFINAYH